MTLRDRSAEPQRIAAIESVGSIAALKCVRENWSCAPPGLDRFPLAPTADAVGCILTPLRG